MVGVPDGTDFAPLMQAHNTIYLICLRTGQGQDVTPYGIYDQGRNKPIIFPTVEAHLLRSLHHFMHPHDGVLLNQFLFLSIFQTNWAAANGVRVVQWFEDSVSGKKDLDNRPALQDLMAALHGNGTKLGTGGEARSTGA